MQSNGFDDLRRQDRARGRKKKADSFWRAFLLTENGKVKSTLALNSFCLCFLFLAVYIAAFALLVGAIHPLVEHLPTVVINLVEALVPAIAGTALCSLLWFCFREKRLLLATYLWLALLAAACFVTVLIFLRGDPQARGYFLQFFVLFVPAPVLLGGGLSAWLYHRHRKRQTAGEA